MKKYMRKLDSIRIILLVLLLPVVVLATENQSIIFTGTYSLNNVATDADTAWLHLVHYDDYIDSVVVTAEDPGWGGYYRYEHLCDQDSVFGWSGIWVFVDNSHGVRVNGIASVATARDSSFDTTGLAESAYAEFIDGTNENQFKADVSALALEASLLTEDDNIGIDWGDIINQDAASVLLTGTSINTVALVTAIDAGGIEEADYASDYWVRMAQTVWDADSATYMDDNDGSMAYGIQQILDSIVGQGTDWSAVGAGSDSATMVRYINYAAWGVYSEDSSAAIDRFTAGGGGCSGTGSYSCTISVVNTTPDPDVVVAGVPVTINNQTEDGTVLTLNTTTDGWSVFSLDDGDYRASAVSPPGTFTATDFTVSGAALHDTIEGTYPTIGTPSAASICSVYSWIQDAAGQKVVGAKITATLVSSVDTMIDGNMLVVDHDPLVTTSDADGYWSFGLIKSSVIDTSAHYQIAVYREQGQSEQAEVYVPDSNTVNYIDLLRSWRR